MTQDADAIDDPRTIRRTVWTIVAVNIWERYAFYTLLSLLPLFLTAEKTAGGFGWSTGQSLAFFGLYSGLMWMSPFVGGLVTDHWLGQARALALGTIILLLGHAILALPYLIPLLIDIASSLPVSAFLEESALAKGRWYSPGALETAFLRETDNPVLRGWAIMAYLGETISFFVALICIIIGNSLFKPTITLLLGRLAFRTDGERDAAYTQLYMGRNIGGAIAGVVAGGLGAYLGWHAAFSTAIFGMAVALVILWISWASFFSPLIKREAASAQASANSSATGISPYLIAGLVALLTCVFFYSVFYDQIYGLALLFIEEEVARTIGGFVVPAPWLITLNSIFIVMLTPLFVMQLKDPSSPLARMSTFARFSVAFLLTALSFGCFLYAAMVAQSQPPSLLWIVAAIFLLTIGEVCISPIGESNIAKLAPANRRTAAMGLWFGGVGFGAFISGLVGAQVEWAGFVRVFGLVVTGALVCAAVTAGVAIGLRLLRPATTGALQMSNSENFASKPETPPPNERPI